MTRKLEKTLPKQKTESRKRFEAERRHELIAQELKRFLPLLAVAVSFQLGIWLQTELRTPIPPNVIKILTVLTTGLVGLATGSGVGLLASHVNRVEGWTAPSAKPHALIGSYLGVLSGFLLSMDAQPVYIDSRYLVSTGVGLISIFVLINEAIGFLKKLDSEKLAVKDLVLAETSFLTALDQFFSNYPIANREYANRLGKDVVVAPQSLVEVINRDRYQDTMVALPEREGRGKNKRSSVKGQNLAPGQVLSHLKQPLVKQLSREFWREVDLTRLSPLELVQVLLPSAQDYSQKISNLVETNPSDDPHFLQNQRRYLAQAINPQEVESAQLPDLPLWLRHVLFESTLVGFFAQNQDLFEQKTHKMLELLLSFIKDGLFTEQSYGVACLELLWAETENVYLYPSGFDLNLARVLQERVLVFRRLLIEKTIKLFFLEPGQPVEGNLGVLANFAMTTKLFLTQTLTSLEMELALRELKIAVNNNLNQSLTGLAGDKSDTDLIRRHAIEQSSAQLFVLYLELMANRSPLAEEIFALTDSLMKV